MTARAVTADLSIGAILNRAFAGLAAAIERRRAYRTLMEMDDRMLSDIGVSRGAILEKLATAQRVDVKAQTVASVSAIVAPVANLKAANEDAALHDAA